MKGVSDLNGEERFWSLWPSVSAGARCPSPKSFRGAREGDGGCHRFWRAEGRSRGGLAAAAAGNQAGADGRSLLRQPRSDRVVLEARVFDTTCARQGWDWRLRLKADLLVFEDGGESTISDCFARGERMLTGIELTGKRVKTNVGMVHEEGHPEPWFIAMSQAPTTARTFDYGLRWGIEAMFSDFKSRGFGLEDSQLQRTDRMDRLILVMTLALYWAVSTGMWAAEHAALPVEKKRPTRLRKRWLAACRRTSSAACAVSRPACRTCAACPDDWRAPFAAFVLLPIF